MPEIVVTDADAGRTISARRGDTIRIELHETPTTGFRWALVALDTRVVTLEGDEFVAQPSAGIGGGGRRVFRLKAQAQGSSSVEFKLARAWEGGARQSVFSIRIAVS